jgi:hypothetical protein
MSEITYMLVVKIENTYADKEASALNLGTLKTFFEKQICESCEIKQDFASIHFVSLTEQE